MVEHSPKILSSEEKATTNSNQLSIALFPVNRLKHFEDSQ